MFTRVARTRGQPQHASASTIITRTQRFPPEMFTRSLRTIDSSMLTRSLRNDGNIRVEGGYHEGDSEAPTREMKRNVPEILLRSIKRNVPEILLRSMKRNGAPEILLRSIKRGDRPIIVDDPTLALLEQAVRTPVRDGTWNKIDRGLENDR